MKNTSQISWIVFSISVIFTILLWGVILNSEHELDRIKFEFETQSITNSILSKLSNYEHVLTGAKGLFGASNKVEYSEWKQFIEIQQVSKNFKGLQGVGFIQHVSNSEKQDFVSEMKPILPEYHVFPEGERNDYFVVKYLEPEDFRNKRAFGYDVYSEQIRHDAINIAINTFTPTITGKLHLMQETDENTQNGFLFMLPFEFEENSVKKIGLVYAVFRMNDFMEYNLDPKNFHLKSLKIYDGFKSDDTLIFDSNNLYPDIPKGDYFHNTSVISLYNHDWVFEYEGLLHLDNHALVYSYIPIIGMIISFLILYTLLLTSKNSRLSQEILRQEKMSIIGKIGATIAHDIRNPLTSLIGSLEILKMKKHILTEDEKKCYSQIQDSVKRIEYLVSDILDFSQTRDLVKTDSSILKLISKAIEEVKIPSDIKISLPKYDVILRVDEVKITSVLANLLKNSVEAIGDKGTISIGLKDYPREAEIIITDSANALSLDAISKIFEPLYTTKANGTGLGLSSCKNIITQHGGKINVSVNPTTFTITLPK